MVVINQEYTIGFILGFLPASEVFIEKRIIQAGTIMSNNEEMKKSNYRVYFHEIGEPEEYKRLFLKEVLSW